MSNKQVVIVGGGFAGMRCAERLLASKNVHITLIDKNNYHKFTPLLYQVATSALTPEAAASSFRHYFAGRPHIDIKMAKAISVDPRTLAVSTEEGESYRGDYLVLATGAKVNFFNTPGADTLSFPLYTLVDAERLRSRIIAAFEDADRDPTLLDQGVLNFVIVGAGPTGTEVAGAIADMLHFALPKEFQDLAIKKTKIFLIDHHPAVLGTFSKASQEYAAFTLQKRGVNLILGQEVKEVTDSYARLSNGEKLLTKTLIWAGGLQPEELAHHCGIPLSQSGRIEVGPDLAVPGFPHIYALGDLAHVPNHNGHPLPQLAAVAQQAGEWAAANILLQIEGKETQPFHYNDKGIMAMIGRNAAVVEIGEKRHEHTGFFAYLTWLFVHVSLLPTFFQKIQAFLDWGWDYFGTTSALQILDRSNSTRIQWNNKNQKP